MTSSQVARAQVDLRGTYLQEKTISVSGNYTVSANESANVFRCTGAGTITLPTPSASMIGRKYWIIAMDTGAKTLVALNSSGGSGIYAPGSISAVSPLTLDIEAGAAPGTYKWVCVEARQYANSYFIYWVIEHNLN